jgi:hypothetical protein
MVLHRPVEPAGPFERREPHHVRIGGLDLGSFTKDGFETHLKSLLCAGKLTLAKARTEIATNWVAYWKAWKGL